MLPTLSTPLLALVVSLASQSCSYSLVRDYSGQDFFSRWDFYGSWDNLTLGDVWWLNNADALSQGLAFVNTKGNAVIKVDNTTNVPFNIKRNSIRITTQDFYDLGSLWIIDLVHMPFGCSVWPAFWTKGQLWPNDGEVDIIEGVNLAKSNQMALHTLPGCTHIDAPNQKGTTGAVNGDPTVDYSNCSVPTGCSVIETGQASFGEEFGAAGGGVWAAQFDVSGVFIWYWTRGQVPASIVQANSTSGVSLFDWGQPSASYPSFACNMTQFFSPQQLVLDITLCGNWAGIGQVYNATCGNSGPTGLCYQDNVVGPGSPRYDDAYFEVKYVRAYTTPDPTPPPMFTSSSSTTLSVAPATTTTPPPTLTVGPSSPGGTNNDGAGVNGTDCTTSGTLTECDCTSTSSASPSVVGGAGAWIGWVAVMIGIWMGALLISEPCLS